MPSGIYNHKPHTDKTKKKMSSQRLGEKHPNWRGGKRNALGYVMICVGKKKYRQEHRIIAEKMLGRPLKLSEIVHHKNHIKHDNRPENLEILSKSEHHRKHAIEYWNRIHSKKGIVRP